ncbi:SDR family oxidoreductase [Sulfurisphaera ohwakuensis]|uniref:SDR family oxidoreductase n=1 Tax=Sulfurisphaera ohwakuensis TaxID=69656 RepID=UPI0036F3214E
MDIRGTNTLITGSAKRIGKEIALGLAKEGSNIILHYNQSETDALKTKDEIEKLGVKCWLIKGDLSNGSESIIHEAISKAKKIDFLINNASVFLPKEFEETTINDLNYIFSVNSWGPLLLIKEFTKVARQGKIINILDAIISGYNFQRYLYYLSKKMLETITLSLALKLAPNFLVNAIAPGLILPPEGKDLSYLEKLKELVPLKTYGNINEVVNAVIFLLKSDFITGQIIYVDGGEHLIPRVIE